MEWKKYRCDCLKIKKCGIGYSWNVNNCRCEVKKLAILIIESKDIESGTDDVKNVSECKSFSKNKAIIKK